MPDAPPAVPGELIEKAAKALHAERCCPLDSASGCVDDFLVYAPERGAATIVLTAVYGDIVEAARRDALTQAAEAIRALDPHEAGDGDSFEWSAAVDEAARIVTDLRDATLRSAP